MTDPRLVPASSPVYRTHLRWPWQRSRQLPGDAAIPPRALLIWNERPDLRAAFPLGGEQGREQLVWWYLRHGFVEYGLKLDQAGDAGLHSLNRPVPDLVQHGALPVTWLMRGLTDLAGVGRATLGDARGQEQLLDWFFARGLMDRNLGALLTGEQAKALLAADPRHPGTPHLLGCLWRARPDLQQQFASPADPAFARWCVQGDGARSFPILRHPLIALAPQPRRAPSLKPFGVNLFGHARARSGISEDLRMAARVLEAAGVPYVIRDVPAGPDIPDEEAGEASFGHDLPYAINLFTFTAPTTVAAVLAMGGHDVIADHYNIGFWPWELPEMPLLWRQAYDFVDEVWASSRYTFDAYCRSSPVPVRHMPFAVVAEDSSGHGRAAFDLPDAPFLFGFAFDGLSGFARKAPLGVVKAFRQAFSADDGRVGLVIKGLRVANDPAWQQVLAAIGGDPRIHLVTRSLDRGSLLDLWRSLDSFVSLHRSEGFGRNIAETMLLGRPVLATAHSGNMDFTLPGAAALVPCSLRPVRQGEYPFGTGQSWAEPDISAAAALMRRMVEDEGWRSALARRGRQVVAEQYSPAAVAKAWSPALASIHAAGPQAIDPHR